MTDLTVQDITTLLQQTIVELQEEPEFQWNTKNTKYATADNQPAVKVALANTPLDYDLWRGLRNAATIGLHPIDLKELWEYHANRRRQGIDQHGRQTIFQIPRSYDRAQENYKRATMISLMLPFNPDIIQGYTEDFTHHRKGSTHTYQRMYQDVNLMADKATSRAAIHLVDEQTAVIPMTNEGVKNVTAEAVPLTRQGPAHGPSKGGNYPQKSIAALTGLGQFGVNRIIFRDEVQNGQVQRTAGPIRSIIVFDHNEPITDGSGGIIYPNEAWRSFLLRLYDFTDTDPQVNRSRFCTYIPQDDEGCGKCIGCCPSGAQPNSTPAVTGKYSEQVSKQAHRFWEGKLQFDYGRCCEERGQMATLYPEWSCARCVSVCVAQGNARPESVEDFYAKKLQLTMELE